MSWLSQRDFVWKEDREVTCIQLQASRLPTEPTQWYVNEYGDSEHYINEDEDAEHYINEGYS